MLIIVNLYWPWVVYRISIIIIWLMVAMLILEYYRWWFCIFTTWHLKPSIPCLLSINQPAPGWLEPLKDENKPQLWIQNRPYVDAETFGFSCAEVRANSVVAEHFRWGNVKSILGTMSIFLRLGALVGPVIIIN